MRVVIDTNRLQSEELWGFLAMSPDNLAILPDYVLRETFKTGRADGVRGAFSILGQFPNQVVALQGTGSVSALNPDAVVTMADAMASRDETAAFPDFLRQLKGAGKGGFIDAALAQRKGWSNEQMDRMLAGFADMAPAMAEFTKPFTAAELSIIRQEQDFTPAMTEKFFGLAASMADAVFEARPELAMPSIDRRPDHYVFRNCPCYAVYMMSKVHIGARAWKGQVARNDSIDVMLAAYGTYFDGVMSHDRLTNEVFHITRFLLSNTGTTTGGDYLSDYFPRVISFMEQQPGEGLLGGAQHP